MSKQHHPHHPRHPHGCKEHFKKACNDNGKCAPKCATAGKCTPKKKAKGCDC